MSLMGELTFFLGLQIKQSTNETFISQIKYTKELIKKFGLERGKAFGTPISPSKCLEIIHHEMELMKNYIEE